MAPPPSGYPMDECNATPPSRALPDRMFACALLPGRDRFGTGRALLVVVAVGDLLTLFEHVIFGLVVGNLTRHRGLVAIFGVVVRVLVVGVLVLWVAVAAGSHGCECCVRVPGTQQVLTRGQERSAAA